MHLYDSFTDIQSVWEWHAKHWVMLGLRIEHCSATSVRISLAKICDSA